MDDERILNKIDTAITKILLCMEIECKKAKGYAWSPLLANAGQTVIAAKWHLSAVLNERLQIRLMDRAHAIIAAKKQLKEAYNVQRKVQKHTKQIQDSFLEDRVEHLASTREIMKVAVVKQILCAERQTITFQKLGTWLKGHKYAQLTCVLVPDDANNLAQTTWKPIDNTQELYKLLMSEGQLHYRQAAKTPLVKDPFSTKIGPFEDNKYCDAILHGDFDTTHLANISEVSNIVSSMCYPDPTNPTTEFDVTITDDEFFKAVYHTHKSTSSSPSGQHYGHYQALLCDPALLGCIASIANFCFQWGITLRRWEKVM